MRLCQKPSRACIRAAAVVRSNRNELGPRCFVAGRAFTIGTAVSSWSPAPLSDSPCCRDCGRRLENRGLIGRPGLFIKDWEKGGVGGGGGGGVGGGGGGGGGGRPSSVARLDRKSPRSLGGRSPTAGRQPAAPSASAPRMAAIRSPAGSRDRGTRETIAPLAQPDRPGRPRRYSLLRMAARTSLLSFVPAAVPRAAHSAPRCRRRVALWSCPPAGAAAGRRAQTVAVVVLALAWPLNILKGSRYRRGTRVSGPQSRRA